MKHVDDLTQGDLRHLYLEQKLTETEIAVEYGISQSRIGRLRKRWGIPTLLKSDRMVLPLELSVKQRSLLIGSMLGDGRLFRTGEQTAAYSEHHSEAQRAYLEWKAGEWGAFTTRISTVNHRGHPGVVFALHASKLFLPYWEMFYPGGSGNKSFHGLASSLVDTFALAVWFMDDGSRTSNGYARFSVGPDKSSQTAQLRILRAFGLHPAIHADDEHGKNAAILIGDRGSYSKFVDLVAPHLLPSMAYKLDVQPRKAGSPPRDVLTRGRLQELFDKGLSLQDVSEITGVPRSSVSGVAKRLGFAPRTAGRPKTRALLSVEDASLMIDQLGKEPSVDQVQEIISRTKIPVRELSQEQAAHDFELLIKCPTILEGDTITHLSRGGAALCRYAFPYIVEGRYKNNPSLKEAWYSSKHVRNAVEFQLRHNQPVTPVRVLRAIRLGVMGPTNFRPCSAKALVDTFCPSEGVVLDPCAGYGGRAVGTLAAGRQYVGVDPHPKAALAFQDLARLIGREVTFYNQPFEDVDLGALQADMVLTSPPYFSVERYSNDPLQSWVRYKTWEAWVAGFLTPMVEKMWRHLKLGSVAVVNTKNIRMGERVYPIGDKLVEIAQNAGFVLEKTLQLPLGRVGKTEKTEPIFVLRKIGRPKMSCEQ